MLNNLPQDVVYIIFSYLYFTSRYSNIFLISKKYNVFIKKSLFLEVNAILQNRYGLDPLFSARLQDLKIVPSHIDNEVYRVYGPQEVH